MPTYTVQDLPPSRIATIDIAAIGKQKHHVVALIEVDVTAGLAAIDRHNREPGPRISFSAWLISAIGSTLRNHETAAAYRAGKRRLLVFEDINVSMIVEKEINGRPVPIPLVIEKAQEKSAKQISEEIAAAKNKELTDADIVLHRKTGRLEKLYYRLPGVLRRFVWRYFSAHPVLAYSKMGNVAFTSVGMMGRVNGWFIPFSIHPVCFGISAIVKKPVVAGEAVAIRDILKMTILLDHDVIDGAPMARFVSELAQNLESGLNEHP